MKAFISSRIPEKWFAILNQNFEIDYYDWTLAGLLSHDELVNRVKGFNLIITESDEITKTIIENNPELCAIVDFRGTVVNVDQDAATQNGVVIINTPGRNAESVADLTVALFVMLARNVIPASNAIKDGSWERNGKRWAYENYQGYDLPGKKIGLIGFGYIGQRVAKRLQGYDVEIIAYDPYIDQQTTNDLNVKMVDWETIFRAPDFLSLHLPLTQQTEGLISIGDLEKMKPTSFLVNTSRAAVIVEKDLINFLKDQKIAGAAFDVYHKEPLPTNYPLLKLPHVLCTPHIGGASHDVVTHMANIGLKGLFEYLSGKPPKNIVNPAAIDRSLNKLKSIVGTNLDEQFKTG